MWGVKQFTETTGIKARRVSEPQTTSVDLCEKAAARLIDNLGWKKEEIDILIFVSQTPDYISPASSCLIQNHLGLPVSCCTLDISLGCSGWVYALSVVAALMQNGTLKKGLLFAGDTITKFCSPEDKSTSPLFGDAGTATALEYKEGSPGFEFIFNTDGNGYETLIVKD